MLLFIPLLILFTSYPVKSHDYVSPCPRLFTYEGKSSEPDKWYGIITLLSESDLAGTWLRLLFDRPTVELGNWLGRVDRVGNESKEFLVKSPENKIKAYVPQTFRFYVRYDPNEIPPKLVLFRLNAKTVCPEGAVDKTTPPPFMVLQTSSSIVTLDNIKPPPLSGDTTINRPPVPSGGSSEEDDFYHGDFLSFFNRPTPKGSSDAEADLHNNCGTVITQPSPLITNGQSTKEGEFPWHVALYHTRGIDISYVCGASLVSEFHVLTAAHCVTRPKSGTALLPDNLVVYFGKYNLRRFSSPSIQDRQVATITPHPDYNARSYSNDIAMIKLSTPVDITDYVRPICLWQDSNDLNRVLNKEGNVVGWGFDETGKLSEKLMQAKMPVVSLDTCVRSYPEFYSRFTSDKTYCAGFRNGTTVCSGDSGGGMIFPKSTSSSTRPVWQLRGIVSLSVALQDRISCDTSNYVVFTDAAKYSDWIRNVMK